MFDWFCFVKFNIFLVYVVNEIWFNEIWKSVMFDYDNNILCSFLLEIYKVWISISLICLVFLKGIVEFW